MAITTGAFAELIAPGLRKVYFDRLKELPEEFSKVFNVETSKRSYEEDLTFAGLGIAQDKTEGGAIIYADPAQGNKLRYTHKSFGLGYRVTREMFDDDLYNVFGTRMSKHLARAARKKTELIAWDVLNNAFNASYPGADGVELCGTHPLIKGGTYSNKPSVAADLSPASLQAAIINLENTVDEDGVRIVLTPKKLIISPDNLFVAKEVLGSDYMPYTSDNQINALKGMGIEIFVCHYLTDPDAWFLVSDEHDLNFFWRRKPDLEAGDDFDTKDAKYTTYFRCSAGHTDWRGVYGSPGA